MTVAYVVFLFLSTNIVGLVLSAALVILCYALAKIPFKMLRKSLKPILPIIIFTVVLNLFFITGPGEPLIQIWTIRIFKEGVMFCLVMAV